MQGLTTVGGWAHACLSSSRPKVTSPSQPPAITKRASGRKGLDRSGPQFAIASSPYRCAFLPAHLIDGRCPSNAGRYLVGSSPVFDPYELRAICWGEDVAESVIKRVARPVRRVVVMRTNFPARVQPFGGSKPRDKNGHFRVRALGSAQNYSAHRIR